MPGRDDNAATGRQQSTVAAVGSAGRYTTAAVAPRVHTATDTAAPATVTATAT